MWSIRRLRMTQAVHGSSPKLWSTGSFKVRAQNRLHSAAGVQSAVQSGRLQQLYDTVRDKLAAGRLSARQDVQEVSTALSNVSVEELGLDAGLVQAMNHGMNNPSMLALRSRLVPRHGNRPQAVTYLDIHSDEGRPESPTSMTIGIFKLPAGTSIPLHDHPGMTVFSRLLYGSLHVRSYDLFEPGDPAAEALRHSLGPAAFTGAPVHPARLVADRVLTAPADAMVLFPRSGNIHAFTAVSHCAILDVLTPPYAPGEGRDCTYFRELLPATATEAKQQLQHQDMQWPWQQAQQPRQQAPWQPDEQPTPALVGLQECDPPADFRVVHGMYCGARVMSW